MLRLISTHDAIKVLSEPRVIINNVNIESAGEYLGVMVNDLHPVDWWVERQADDEAIENVPRVLEMLEKTSQYQLYEVNQLLGSLLSLKFCLN